MHTNALPNQTYQVLAHAAPGEIKIWVFLLCSILQLSPKLLLHEDFLFLSFSLLL